MKTYKITLIVEDPEDDESHKLPDIADQVVIGYGKKNWVNTGIVFEVEEVKVCQEQEE